MSFGVDGSGYTSPTEAKANPVVLGQASRRGPWDLVVLRDLTERPIPIDRADGLDKLLSIR